MELNGILAGLGKDALPIFTARVAKAPPSGCSYEKYKQFSDRWKNESSWIIVCDKAEYDNIALMRPKCLGIITEIGGITCHGSIMMREHVMEAMKRERQYNKVVIVGATDATKLLKDGATIQISINIGNLKVTIATT